MIQEDAKRCLKLDEKITPLDAKIAEIAKGSTIAKSLRSIPGFGAVCSSELAGAIRGVYTGTNVNGKDLTDPSFLPIFKRVEELRLPVFLHPAQVIPTDRFKPYFFYNLIGFPVDTAIAVGNLIFSGMMDRFPRLQICLPHSGGALLSLIGRMDRGHRINEECRQMKRKPSAYLKRFTYDTITHDPGMLLHLIRLVGAQRVMIGSDYCFAIGYDRPVEVITKLAGLSRADQGRILGSNAAHLLKLR